jgi:hypothetical protein
MKKPDPTYSEEPNQRPIKIKPVPWKPIGQSIAIFMITSVVIGVCLGIIGLIAISIAGLGL